MSTPDHIAEARRHLSEAFSHLDQAETLDELTTYAVATVRGDVGRLVRRLTGLLARQVESDGPGAA